MGQSVKGGRGRGGFVYCHGGCSGLAGGDCSSQPISGLVGRAYVSFTVNEEGGQRCYQWLDGL